MDYLIKLNLSNLELTDECILEILKSFKEELKTRTKWSVENLILNRLHLKNLNTYNHLI